MAYRLEPDLHNPRLVYIYEDTENATRCKMTIIQDYDLAHRILGYLNGTIKDVEFEPIVKNNKPKKRKSKELVVKQ